MKILLFLLILFISNFCKSPKHMENHKQDTSMDDVIKPKLFKQLSSICSEDTLRTLNSCQYPLIITDFIKENDNCFLYIIPSPFYSEEKAMGSYKIDDKIIVFYVSDNSCSNDLLNKDKLKRNVRLDEYPKESSFLKRNDIFEPEGVKCKIVNKDSLVLIHRGKF